MSDFILDLTGYKDRVGSRVDEGRYRVIVEDAEMDKSKAGNAMVNIWYRVLDGEFAGATLIDRLTITEKALFRIYGFMQAIGLPTPKKRLQLNTRLFIGKVLEIDVEDGDPYNGRIKSEVRGYLRASNLSGSDGQNGSAADVSDLADLDDLDTSGLDEDPSFEPDPTQDAVPAEAQPEPAQPVAKQPQPVAAAAPAAEAPVAQPVKPEPQPQPVAAVPAPETIDLSTLDLG